jgi:hypothetical protein
MRAPSSDRASRALGVDRYTILSRAVCFCLTHFHTCTWSLVWGGLDPAHNSQKQLPPKFSIYYIKLNRDNTQKCVENIKKKLKSLNHVSKFVFKYPVERVIFHFSHLTQIVEEVHDADADSHALCLHALDLETIHPSYTIQNILIRADVCLVLGEWRVRGKRIQK